MSRNVHYFQRSRPINSSVEPVVSAIYMSLVMEANPWTRPILNMLDNGDEGRRSVARSIRHCQHTPANNFTERLEQAWHGGTEFVNARIDGILRSRFPTVRRRGILAARVHSLKIAVVEAGSSPITSQRAISEHELTATLNQPVAAPAIVAS
jgi:hypothetical protein